MYFAGSPGSNSVQRVRDVLAVPGERDLSAPRLVAHRLQGVAPDEIVVELTNGQ